jgi:hypothetical protein
MDNWKIFKRFLKERGLYARYCCYYRNQLKTRKVWLILLRKDSLLELDANDYINYSFSWARTIEGFDFWQKIDANWKMYYNNMTI